MYRFISPVKRQKLIKASTLFWVIVLMGVGYFQLHNLATGLASMVTTIDDAPVVAAAEDKYQFISCPGKATTDKSVSFIPTHIKIANADIDLRVVSVPLEKQTWKVFPSVANYAEGTGQVTLQGGNVGIFGHDRADAFTNIKKLVAGDTIEVFDAGHKAIYRVKSAEVVKPNQVSVFFPTKDPTLTLTTCDGVFSEARYAVTAELVSIQDMNCN